MDKMNKLLASYLLEEFDNMIMNTPSGGEDYERREFNRLVEKFREKLVLVLNE